VLSFGLLSRVLLPLQLAAQRHIKLSIRIKPKKPLNKREIITQHLWIQTFTLIVKATRKESEVMLGNGDVIKQSGNNNMAIQNSEVHITVSIFDEIKRHASEGNYNEVLRLLKQANDFVGIQHPLFPHYKYKPVQLGESMYLEHEPLTEEAHEKYPLSYRGKFTIPNEQLEGFENFQELIEDAYYKQKEIEVDMVSLVSWLGSQPYETPNIEEAMNESKWIIKPKPLPEPLTLKFYIKDPSEKTIVDYLEMSVFGKDDKNQYLIINNNRQANSKLLVTLKIPLNHIKSHESIKTERLLTKIDVRIMDDYKSNVEANKLLLQFLLYAQEGNNTLAFKNLQKDNDLLVATEFELNSEFSDLEKEYNFVDRLYKLEQHYNVIFEIPERIEEDAWETIEILESAKDNKPISKNLNNLKINLSEKEFVGKLIDLFESKGNCVKKLMIQASGEEGRVELFGAVIPIEKIQTVYNSLKLDDLDRVKRKYKDMEEGETIRITLLPGEDKVLTETYFINKVENHNQI
jgi:hypothetical protein